MLSRLLLPVLKNCLVILDKAFLLTRKQVDPRYPYDKRKQAINLPKEVEQPLQSLIADGKKVEAIRQVARLTGAGLRVSKDYVDHLAWKNRGRKYKHQRNN